MGAWNNKIKMFDTAAVIVAHPDDEILWCGGMILLYPAIKWVVITMSRKSDVDRAPKFFRAMEYLNATGIMGELDDGPEQKPLSHNDVQTSILSLLPSCEFDLIVTHSHYGEYTRHRRHEETGKAVTELWKQGRLTTKMLWIFAYEDNNKRYLPRAIKTAHIKTPLPKDIWERKYDIITRVYGFPPKSFEAKTTPTVEAFWCFKNFIEFHEWYKKGGKP